MERAPTYRTLPMAKELHRMPGSAQSQPRLVHGHPSMGSMPGSIPPNPLKWEAGAAPPSRISEMLAGIDM